MEKLERQNEKIDREMWKIRQIDGKIRQIDGKGQNKRFNIYPSKFKLKLGIKGNLTRC